MCRSVTLGLLSAPGLPYALAKKTAANLPGLLETHIDDRVSWEVTAVCDPLTGSEMEMPEFLEACRDRSHQEGWDLAIYLTDLPMYADDQIIVADLSEGHRVAGLSLPALGAVRLRRRAREVILQLAAELHAVNRRQGQHDDEKEDDPTASCQLTGGWFSGRLVPIRRFTSSEAGIATRFASPAGRGHLRLLPGMVRINRPWQLLLHLEHVVAAAFATGAFGLIFPSVWKLGDAFGAVRLVAAMVLAVVAMVFWLIVSSDLWEPSTVQPGSKKDRSLTGLYNTTTVLTLSTSVLLSYAVIFIFLLLAAVIFIPKGHLQSILGHPVKIGEYLVLAWVATSIATVGGALGAGLEDKEEVRKIAFGYRQRLRLEQSQNN